MNADPYANYNSYNARAQAPGRGTGSLFSFPFIVIMTYLWPVPGTFARHKDYATWSILIVLLVLLALITGVCAYVWGRLLSLSRGIQALSLHHLAPHPLSLGIVIMLALGVPLLILAFAGTLHILAHMQQGQGSYRAQLYSILVIGTSPVLMLLAIVLLLSVAPALGGVVRIPCTAIVILLLLYSIFLLFPSLMGVQQLSVWKATLCLVAILTAILLIVFCSDMFTSESTPQGGRGHVHKRARNRHERLCSYCGFSLEVYDQLHPTLTQYCPRCGKPLF